MKSNKEISENYIRSAERYLNQNDMSSIEWAVVHYKRAVIFDQRNHSLRKRFVEVFNYVSEINKTLKDEDIQKTLIIKKFIFYLTNNSDKIKSLTSEDFNCEYSCYGNNIEMLTKNLKYLMIYKNQKIRIAYFFIANRFNPCIVVEDNILRFEIKNNKIKFTNTQNFDGADISNLLIWENN